MLDCRQTEHLYSVQDVEDDATVGDHPTHERNGRRKQEPRSHGRRTCALDEERNGLEV